MNAKSRELYKFMNSSDTQFIVPVYQRKYDWSIEHCKQLLIDILKANEQKALHFIGSIVYIEEDLYQANRDEFTKYSIIDGQQRLTTLILLWSALYRKMQEFGYSARGEEIKDKYIINRYYFDDNKFKLKLTKDDQIAFKHLLSADYKEPNYLHSNVIKNFNFFYNAINQDNIDNIKLGITRLLFVEISLTHGKDNPQLIFESLNSTGLDLSQGDLIRNYILMPLDTKQQEIIFEDYWLPIEKLTTDKETHKIEISDFMRHYLTLENYKIPVQRKVYETFKTNFSTVEIDKLLKKIKQYARYFNKLINPIEEQDKKIREQITNIKKLEINVSYPFLLEVYHDYTQSKIDKETFIKVLKLIQSFVWRRFIVGLPTNSLNKIFVTLHKNVENTNYSVEYLLALQIALLKKEKKHRFPNNEEVFAALKTKDMYNIKPKNRTYFLEQLENHCNIEKVLIKNNEHITIEHIFPQGASKKWKENIGEIEFEKSKKRLHTIANLTLSGNNGALGRKLFLQKRDLPEKGYGDSRLFLNRFLKQINQWTTDEYEKRLQILQDRFKAIWVYPEVVISIEENQAINIFEAKDPTGKELEYFVFLAERVNIKSYIGMYKHIVKGLFLEEKEAFLNSNLQIKLGITYEKSILNDALILDNVYYCERKLSSLAIFRRLKHVLSFFNMEDELLIKFKDTVNQEQASLV